jgi:hypothetical protein
VRLTDTAKVAFDLNADGRAERLGAWVGRNDPFLVRPTSEGKVESGAELFGNHTGRRTYANGFEALRTLDSDGDGWITANDRDEAGRPVLESLALWQDNGDGRANPDELVYIAGGKAKPLNAVFVTDIVRINRIWLNYQNMTDRASTDGSGSRQAGSIEVVRSNGKVEMAGLVFDVWFSTNAP